MDAKCYVIPRDADRSAVAIPELLSAAPLLDTAVAGLMLPGVDGAVEVLGVPVVWRAWLAPDRSYGFMLAEISGALYGAVWDVDRWSGLELVAGVDDPALIWCGLADVPGRVRSWLAEGAMVVK